MGKTRAPIPKAIRDSVLKEYSHLCAVCGSHSPQLHHIDEESSNSTPDNLIPLCPNCHLRDQHNPTRRIEIDRLKLFRRHRDPAILSPQFQPLFKRLAFLYAVEINTDKVYSLSDNVGELCEFVASLQMGEFYQKRLLELLKCPPNMGFLSLGSGPTADDHRRDLEHRKSYREQLVTAKPAAEQLVIELLRYQPWKYVPDSPLGR